MEKENLKIVLFGDEGVGKTTLYRSCDRIFKRDYSSIIGVDIGENSFVLNDIPVSMLIWDISNHPKFDKVRHHYYKDTDGVMLIYDITRPETFEHLPEWIEKISKDIPKSIKIALIGNKADLEDQRTVNRERGEKFSKSYPKIVLFEEISARTGQNVRDVYESFARIILHS